MKCLGMGRFIIGNGFCSILQFQQSQVHKYCLQYYGRTHHGRLFETMVLVSKEHKAGLCPVPKAASTTQKILMVHSILRTIPDSYSTVVKGVNYNVLRQEATKLALARLSSVDKLAALNEYFLVFMFRNPFDRLLSAYRSKFSRLQLNRKEFYKEKVWILLHYQPGVYKKWLEAHRSYSVNISFGDFVDFLTTTHQLDNDPHFMSVMSLCNPCKVRFSYYGNFKTFEQDIGVLMNKIQALKGELRVKSPKSFSSHIAQYYRQLNEMQKRRVLEKLSTDLEFYYYIFPAEKTNDEEMLQMKVN